MTDTEALDLAQQTYYRYCCLREEFFAAIYKELIKRRPEVRPMFAHTDWLTQYTRLRLAFSLLFLYAIHQDAGVLERIAERHSRRDLKIDPAWYDDLVEVVLATASRFVPDWDARTAQAWARALTPGLDYMKAKF